jgi:hypothetical protein
MKKVMLFFAVAAMAVSVNAQTSTTAKPATTAKTTTAKPAAKTTATKPMAKTTKPAATTAPASK